MSVFIDIKDIFLIHYGVGKLDGAPGRGSGRYPLGSGDKPNQHSGNILDRIEELKRKGITQEKDIAESLGLTTTQLRIQKSLANDEIRSAQVATAKRLRSEGLSLNQIAEKMGFANDSSVRTLLNEKSEARMNQAKKTAEFLKNMVDEKGMIDVGNGVERSLGNISREKLNEALYILKLQGYEVYGGGVPQVTNRGKQTNIKVLCPPGTEHKEIYNFENVHSVDDYDKILTDDGTKIRKAFEYPASLDSSRLMINYPENGGKDKDGVVELRRGVPDLSLGESNYAQVRILVDGTHYIKGMAVYSDDLPDGIDARFNTSKPDGTPVLGSKDYSVLKPIKKDPDNPFGSAIKEHGGQSYYIGSDGKEHLSLINKRADEGDWSSWNDKLPSQFLAKQPQKLIDQQLNLTIADKKAEYDEIKNLNNPTIKKQMLLSFAEDCDSAAVHLKAAALPGQKYQVILPLKSVGDNEVYAPNFKDGETVALIRYPHQGTFEIPICKVNNKNKEGISVITKNARDAVGINSRVAVQLSGADFDGDTVMVIPIGGRVKIKNKEPFKELQDFDAKIEYGPGSTDVPYKRMKDTQNQMGRISNLITDMTIKKATDEELIRATKHSMVVIDAEKHNLDYKRSEKENGIPALKRKYQGRYDDDGNYHEGASTILSRAKGQTSVDKRQGSPRINDDGTLSWKTTDKLYYVDKNGKTIKRTQKSTQMMETSDAMSLVSEYRAPQEIAYANFANEMKSLANEARREYKSTGNLKYNPVAKVTYSKEVSSLESKLNNSEKNAPRERMAQMIANTTMKSKKQANPDMDREEYKKASNKALAEARLQVGARREPINITDREWEAIQAGAITENKLSKIIRHVDDIELKQRATPRTTKELSTAKQNKIKAMKNSGYTNAEIAEAVGVSKSTVSKYL